MERLNYWAVWYKTCEEDTLIEVFTTKKAAQECRKHLQALSNIDTNEKNYYISQFTVNSDFDPGEYEPVPEKICYRDGMAFPGRLSNCVDYMNDKATDKIWIETDLRRGGFANYYGFIFYFDFIPSFYERDYINKGKKKTARFSERIKVLTGLDSLRRASPLKLMEAGFKPVKNQEKWETIRKVMTGKQYDTLFDYVIELEGILGDKIGGHEFYKEI